MARRRTPSGRRPSRKPPIPRRVEAGPDGRSYEVQPVAGARAVKTYRCPGCDHEIRSGTPHVVVWPAGDDGRGLTGVDDRRHWHSSCWASRGTRGPTRKWS